MAASPDLARMIHPQHAQRLGALIDDAAQRGAIHATGGQHDAGLRYVAPTLLIEVSDDAHISQEEIFGPVLPIAALMISVPSSPASTLASKPSRHCTYGLDVLRWPDTVRSQTSSAAWASTCVCNKRLSNLPLAG